MSIRKSFWSLLKDFKLNPSVSIASKKQAFTKRVQFYLTCLFPIHCRMHFLFMPTDKFLLFMTLRMF